MFATAFTATMITALYMVFTFFGPLIEASAGPNPEIRTGFLVLNGIGAVIGNLVGGFLADRIGSWRTLIFICIAQIAIMPLFSIIPMTFLELAIVIATWSAFSFAFMAPQQARVAQFAPQAIGIVLSINAAMIYIGITIGSAVGSRILGWYGLEALGIAGGLVAVLALVHLIASGQPRPLSSNPPAGIGRG
jgi:predicted MFS family arabinose efflux permease